MNVWGAPLAPLATRRARVLRDSRAVAKRQGITMRIRLGVAIGTKLMKRGHAFSHALSGMRDSIQRRFRFGMQLRSSVERLPDYALHFAPGQSAPRNESIRNTRVGSPGCGAPSDLDLPGYRLHPLKGNLKGMWSVTLSGNWRIVFRFEDGDAFDVDLVDYH